jgi:hypothetical protein
MEIPIKFPRLALHRFTAGENVMTIQRRVLVALAGLAVVAVNAAPCAADNITYSIYDSTPAGMPFKAIYGLITLDGTLGIVSTANIVDWTLTMQDTIETLTFVPYKPYPPGPDPGTHPATLSIAPSSIVATSNGLWAYNEGGGGLQFWGFYCGGCGPNYMWSLGGANGEIDHFFLTVVGQPASAFFTENADREKIGSPVPEPVPEPSTMWMVGSVMLAGGIRRYGRAFPFTPHHH